MARMAVMDAEAERLAAGMNGATGEAKIDAMAALLTTLIDQRFTMRRELMQMHHQMLQRMQMPMKPAGRNDEPPAKDGKASCSMMKQHTAGRPQP